MNKFIWSGLGWDPEGGRGADSAGVQPLFHRRALHRFVRPGASRARAQLARAACRRTRRSTRPSRSSRRWSATASPRDLRNWRFQQALYRAYYDASVRSRLLHETAVEERALERLRKVASGQSREALTEAGVILAEAKEKQPNAEWRLRVYTLAEALFQSIRQQLSVARYGAIAVGRGATLDSFETPLNNGGWLAARFAEAAALETEDDRLAAIARIVSWTDAGPGGYYDDLGNPAQQPHLVRGLPYREDPQRFKSTMTGFGYRPDWRLSWMTHAESFWDTPLQMRYTGLDTAAQYRVRVVYAGDVFSMTTPIRLVANDRYEVHPPIQKPSPVKPVEFDVPIEATRGGDLTLTFSAPPGMGSAGRGNQIAEVWLLRK